MAPSRINDLKQDLHHSRAVGDWQEESRCLNAIAAKYKALGEYVRAISYLEADYRMLKERSLSPKEQLELLLPTIQSLGELYKCREEFGTAVRYQKEHRDLALNLSHIDPTSKELQRAECQLGNTYMDMADREKDDSSRSEELLKRAKRHLDDSLQLAEASGLEKPRADAHNNVGLLAMQMNDMELALKHFREGLALCKGTYPDSEALLHHSLGSFFQRQGNKEQAAKHMRRDITICHQIKAMQGEGKGYLNLGDLHSKFQSYYEAIDAFRKALSIFRGLADEDELVGVAEHNIRVALEQKAAQEKLDEAPRELRRLETKLAAARGTDKERALQSEKVEKLRQLFDAAELTGDAEQARNYAEQAADLASWLGDLTLQADASSWVGDAYYKLEKYREAEKWHRRSFDYSEKIKSDEGMAVAKINLGNCLDWLEQPDAAMRAYQQAYKIAMRGSKLLDQQRLALENLLAVLERRNDEDAIKKVSKKLEQLKKLKKERERAEPVPDTHEEDSDNDNKGPVPRIPRKQQKVQRDIKREPSARQKRASAPATDGSKSFEQTLGRGDLNPRTLSGVEKTRDTSKERSSGGQTPEASGKEDCEAAQARRSSVGITKRSGDQILPKAASCIDHLFHRRTEGHPKKKQRTNETLQEGELTSHRKEDYGENAQSKPAVKRRGRVIVDSQESEEEEPTVIKRRRVSLNGTAGENVDEGRKSGLKQGKKEQVSVDLEGRERQKIREGSAGDAAEGKHSQVSAPASKDVRQVLEQQRGHHFCEGATLEGSRPVSKPNATALADLTNCGRKPDKEGTRGMQQELPRRMDPEDLKTTQQVDPLTQMGDSEDPHGEEDLLENPLGFLPSLGTSRDSKGRVERKSGGGVVGARPAVDLNEQSSAGGGRKKQATGRETMSENTGSFRGSQAPSILVKIHDQTLKVILRAPGDESPPKSVAWLMEEIVRLYSSDSVTGGSPIIRRLTHKGVTLKPVQMVEEVLGDLEPGEALDAYVDGWTRKPLLARYKAHCAALSQEANVAVLEKLAEKVESDEEVHLPECGLSDASAAPLLAALEECESLTSLDLSRNALGNRTAHKIQELLTSQADLSFTLDLHSNQLGPGALTQLSRCPVVLSRLEVLDLSGNRLTDAAGRHLANLLERGSALLSLGLDTCGLTGRTFTALANALRTSAPLSKLRIGHNNPVPGGALAALLHKLAALSSFSELDISGVSVDANGASALGRLLCRSQNLQSLNIAQTNLRDVGAAALADALAAGGSATCCSLDLSSCHFTAFRAPQLWTQLMRCNSLTSLSMQGNKIGDEAAAILCSSISDPTCSLRQLDVSNCSLSEDALTRLVRAVAGTCLLEELRLAGNCHFPSQPSATSSRMEEPTSGGAEVKEVIPESEDEDDVSMRRQTTSFQTSGSPAVHDGEPALGRFATKAHLQQDGAQRRVGCEGKGGLKDGSERDTRSSFEELLSAVHVAESLRLLDVSRNGLGSMQCQQLRTAFQRANSAVEDGWEEGFLKRN